jgi:hypothetical protein
MGASGTATTRLGASNAQQEWVTWNLGGIGATAKYYGEAHSLRATYVTFYASSPDSSGSEVEHDRYELAQQDN